jgi:hypothetical protein
MSANPETAVTLTLHVENVNPDLTQMRWLDCENGDRSYRVSADQLDGAANDVRTHLQNYLNCYIRAKTPDSMTVDSPETVAALERLVDAGRVLFDSLFLSSDKSENARKAREQYLLLDEAGPLKLVLKVGPTRTLPWSLIVPDSVVRPERGFRSGGLASTFWGLRHEMSVATFGVGGKRQAIAGNQYRALAGMNRWIYDVAKASLGTGAERQWLDDLEAGLKDGVAFDSRRFIDCIQRAAGDQNVLLRFAYLLGHASGEYLQFSETDQLSASELAARLDYLPDDCDLEHTILFLNGCDTATEGERFSFAKLVGRFNVSALIGTEVKVPDRFAFRFALAFLRLVIHEGLPLRQALAQLRRKHLPISLAYSLYAAEGLTITPTAANGKAVRQSLLDENYSEGDVKCKKPA